VKEKPTTIRHSKEKWKCLVKLLRLSSLLITCTLHVILVVKLLHYRISNHSHLNSDSNITKEAIIRITIIRVDDMVPTTFLTIKLRSAANLLCPKEKLNTLKSKEKLKSRTTTKRTYNTLTK
jgi:hypothetical protein